MFIDIAGVESVWSYWILRVFRGEGIERVRYRDGFGGYFLVEDVWILFKYYFGFIF